jgi:hypothetical protein
LQILASADRQCDSLHVRNSLLVVSRLRCYQRANSSGRAVSWPGRIRVCALLLPGGILILLWILAFRVYPPFATRRKFRQARNLHGEIVNELTAEGLWQKTEGGSYGFSKWKDFSYWRESEQIIIVVYPTNVFCLLPKSDLSSDQCAELRGILTSALPQK